MLEKTETPAEKKAELIKSVSKFSIKDLVSEEEFDSSLDRLAATLLFGTRWETPMISNPKMRRDLPMLDDMPLECKADDCEYARVCPILKAIQAHEKVKLIGTRCRVEKDLILKSFAAHVHELDIAPTASTDILNVASMVRLEVLLHRINWRMAIKGFMEPKVGAVIQKTGEIVWQDEPTMLFKHSADIGKQLSAIQSQLMASRKDRAALAGSKGATDFLTQLLSRRNAIEAESRDLDPDDSYIDED